MTEYHVHGHVPRSQQGILPTPGGGIIPSHEDPPSRPPDSGQATSQPSTSYSTQEAAATHDGLTLPQYMLAGSIAGMVEHMAMFPVDTVKTRMQVFSAGGTGYHTVTKAVSTIVKREGPAGLYRGIGAMGLGAGPAHAVYFSVYELAKDRLGGNRPGHHVFAHATSGALATIASDAVFTPMDVIKQRLQLKNSPYRGVLDCALRVLREEGFGAFYASYRTTVIMNVPFTAVHFATYEGAKKILIRHSGSGSEGAAEEETFFTHLTAGGLAGALASAVTTPLDVVKTRLQTQGVEGAQKFASTSVLRAARQIVAQEGAGALWRGVWPRVMFHTPAAAICWSTYEACKSFLQEWNAKQGRMLS